MKFFLNIFFTKMVNLLLKTLQIHFCSKFTLCPTAWWPCSCHQRIPKIFVKKYWEVVVMNYAVLFEKKYFKKKSLISMKIIQCFLITLDGSKFWSLPWFPAKNHPHQTFLAPVKVIHTKYSKQFKWNSYFYVSGQNRPFWAALNLL